MVGWAYLVLNVLCMYLAGQIAIRRGRSLKTWLWLGAIFGPFALAAVSLMPALQDSEALA